MLEKHKKLIMKVSAALLLLAGIFGGCSYINKCIGLKDDNALETIAEGIIESQTGIDIDLSPENPDKDSLDLDLWTKNQ